MIKKMVKLPVVLVVLFMSTMILVGSLNLTPSFEFQYQLAISLVIFSFGVLIIAVSGYTFRKEGTTVNPMTPERTRHLVKDGIYSVSRNPMYIGFLSWLLACVFFIGNFANILLLPLYVLLVNKLYIAPEEEALRKLFGSEFEKYENKVRRWC